MLFAESPGFSPSREFSCFLPSPFVQLSCAQSGDPGGASASGQFSSDQEASKALGHTFLSFLPTHSAMTFSIVSSHLWRLWREAFLLPECLPYRRHRELTILRRGRKLICDQDWSDSVTLSLCGVSCKLRGLPLSENDLLSRLWDDCFYPRLASLLLVCRGEFYSPLRQVCILLWAGVILLPPQFYTC